MNPVQLGIIVVIGVVIIALVSYFWYQEVKFKKLVERNFNQKTEDAINSEQTLVLDGTNINKESAKKNVLAKDIFAHPDDDTSIAKLFDENVIDKSNNVEKPLAKVEKVIIEEQIVEENFPEDSVEAIFANIKKIPFPFSDKIDFSLDYVINIVFEDTVKIKVLPDVASLTQKQFRIYVLDSNNNWLCYEKGNKYLVKAFKFVIHLVDKNGIMNQAQISNVYNELFKFAMQHKGFIEQTNFEKSIISIREQLKYLSEIELDLELYLILKTPADYSNLAKFFMNNHFTEIGGQFNYIQNGVTQFLISDEQNNGLQKGNKYSLLRIVSNLHFVPDPEQVVESILDISEKFVQEFEARLLTTNKQLFNEREYNALNRHINNYVSNAKKYGVNLGGELIRRLL